MRAVVTRVSSASVTIDGAVRGAIEKGYLVLLGVVPRIRKLCAISWPKKSVICGSLRTKTENELNLEQVGALFWW